MPTIVHFDIPADDIGRAKRFYEELFGWRVEKVPGEMPYFFIETEGMEGQKGVGGGMAGRESPGQQICNFIGVTSIDRYIEKVEELGGTVIRPRTPIVGWGFLAVCRDTENNVFGLWEEDRDAEM